jgi:perosamine synthetase
VVQNPVKRGAASVTFISQMEPWLGDEEKNAVAEYLGSGGWLTEFRQTREFEQAIAEYMGCKYCSVVANGTVSLFAALKALDIGTGDEVIVPDYTMIASANAVVLAGAKPVFVDVERQTLCLDLKLTEKAITPKTKATMLVTLNGRAPDMKAFCDLAQRRGVFLVEDAAQSLGSFQDGRHLGTFGAVGSFSFSAPKVITTGQGGALVTDDEKLFKRILLVRDFGRPVGGIDFHETVGYNFKFTDLQAVVGLEQMKKLPWRVTRKREMFRLYRDRLADVEEVEFLPTNLAETSPWFIDVLVPDPLALQGYLKEHGIGSRPFYPAIHSQPAYGLPGSYTNSEYAATHGLWLPSSSFLSDEDVSRVCEAIRSFYHG